MPNSVSDLRIGTAKARTKATLKLGRVNPQHNARIEQFTLLGRSLADGTLAPANKNLLTVTTPATSWRAAFDFNTPPDYDDTLTVGPVTLHLVRGTSTTPVGPFEVACGEMEHIQYYSGYMVAQLKTWFAARPQYGIYIIEDPELYNTLIFCAYAPGARGNGPASSTYPDLPITVTPGVEAIRGGGVDQDTAPVGIAAFPADPGEAIPYFTVGTFDPDIVVWPTYVPRTLAGQQQALQGCTLALGRTG